MSAPGELAAALAYLRRAREDLRTAAAILKAVGWAPTTVVRIEAALAEVTFAIASGNGALRRADTREARK